MSQPRQDSDAGSASADAAATTGIATPVGGRSSLPTITIVKTYDLDTSLAIVRAACAVLDRRARRQAA